jgi:hypothetical protein
MAFQYNTDIIPFKINIFYMRWKIFIFFYSYYKSDTYANLLFYTMVASVAIYVKFVHIMLLCFQFSGFS